jgi:hypothetical protein
VSESSEIVVVAACETHGAVILKEGLGACPMCRLQAELDKAQEVAASATETLARITMIHGGELTIIGAPQLPILWHLDNHASDENLHLRLTKVPHADC